MKVMDVAVEDWQEGRMVAGHDRIRAMVRDHFSRIWGLRARALLDEVLDAMAYELRVPFVLFELDELTVPQIAEMLQLPEGTASSRLRRARDEFRRLAAEKREAIK